MHIVNFLKGGSITMLLRNNSSKVISRKSHRILEDFCFWRLFLFDIWFLLLVQSLYTRKIESSLLRSFYWRRINCLSFSMKTASCLSRCNFRLFCFWELSMGCWETCSWGFEIFLHRSSSEVFFSGKGTSFFRALFNLRKYVMIEFLTA